MRLPFIFSIIPSGLTALGRVSASFHVESTGIDLSHKMGHLQYCGCSRRLCATINARSPPACCRHLHRTPSKRRASQQRQYRPTRCMIIICLMMRLLRYIYINSYIFSALCWRWMIVRQRWATEESTKVSTEHRVNTNVIFWSLCTLNLCI